MLLRYPITSYGSHHVELTGGLLTRFEDFIIQKFSDLKKRRRMNYELDIMSDRELADLGLQRTDIALIVDGKYNATQDKRR
ncbi:hypothetical protein MTBPR1_90050 [Candidatus Terasakiella magnetica]|uniref:YjiS-like domain-containing protein n=1 Tax=Candidatus Terasakiella magnetica TaxID=1867952 RepID=A0A1C3RLS4_9PROT|nr:DUF1127 domain-containing protein [Candidatus Terasakiella magnetica]SCA58203.1 hypothetical protein MTBPR1_90050 [Candidatus Terasakiella magnetica]